MDSEVREDEFTATAEVALSDMFGYSSHLRGITQGKGKCVVHSRCLCMLTTTSPTGEFSMEYKEHRPVLPNIQKEIEEAYKKTFTQKK